MQDFLKSLFRECSEEELSQFIPGPLRTLEKPRKAPRREESYKIVQKARESLSVSLENFSFKSIWETSDLNDRDDFEASSPAPDEFEDQLKRPLLKVSKRFRRNKATEQETECARRIMLLYVSHFADYCEGLPEIPECKRPGRSTRSYAYSLFSEATGEKVDTIRRTVHKCRKYLTLMKRGGVSRVLEIDSTKSWM